AGLSECIYGAPWSGGIGAGYDLAGMRSTYAGIQALFPGARGMVGAIGTAAIDRVAQGAFEFVAAANAEIMRQQSSIGLPPGYDLTGAVPEGFDVDAWRTFLSQNKKPGNWPLLAQYLQAAGIPFLLNSTFRP